MRYIVGSVIVASFVGLLYTLPKEDLSKATYEKSDLSVLNAPSADDARNWLEARYIDQETGERITNEKLALIEQDLRRLPHLNQLLFILKVQITLEEELELYVSTGCGMIVFGLVVFLVAYLFHTMPQILGVESHHTSMQVQVLTFQVLPKLSMAVCTLRLVLSMKGLVVTDCGTLLT